MEGRRYLPAIDKVLARVMTLNIWNLSGPWRQRRQEILAWLDLTDPDVVCLQEVVESSDGRNQARWLAERAAGDYHVAYAGRPSPAGAGAGGSPARFGNAILSRWPIEAEHGVDLPDSPLPLDVGRVVLHARTGGLDVFCTHLSWRLDDGVTREAQVRLLAEVTGDLSAPASGVPPILAGDLNAEPGSREVSFLLGRSSLEGRSTAFHDAWTMGGGDGPGWTWDNRNPFAVADREADKRIDYVMAGWRPGCGVWIRRAELVGHRALTGTYASDHFGVLAEVVGPERA